MLRTGIQWKALPHCQNFVSGSCAHQHFQLWTKLGIFESAWEDALNRYDEIIGLDWKWQSLDGFSTKAPLGGERTGPNPTDRGKLGVNRSILTEAQGIPIAIAVDAANVHDNQLLEATLNQIRTPRPDPYQVEQHLCLDKGYTGEEHRDIVLEYGYHPHIPQKDNAKVKLTRQQGRRKPLEDGLSNVQRPGLTGFVEF